MAEKGCTCAVISKTHITVWAQQAGLAGITCHIGSIATAILQEEYLLSSSYRGANLFKEVGRQRMSPLDLTKLP